MHPPNVCVSWPITQLNAVESINSLLVLSGSHSPLPAPSLPFSLYHLSNIAGGELSIYDIYSENFKLEFNLKLPHNNIEKYALCTDGSLCLCIAVPGYFYIYLHNGTNFFKVTLLCFPVPLLIPQMILLKFEIRFLDLFFRSRYKIWHLHRVGYTLSTKGIILIVY
jgi:hypothetical protein